MIHTLVYLLSNLGYIGRNPVGALKFSVFQRWFKSWLPRYNHTIGAFCGAVSAPLRLRFGARSRGLPGSVSGLSYMCASDNQRSERRQQARRATRMFGHVETRPEVETADAGCHTLKIWSVKDILHLLGTLHLQLILVFRAVYR